MGAVYKQLSIEERRRIERWRHAVPRRCRSTIWHQPADIGDCRGMTD